MKKAQKKALRDAYRELVSWVPEGWPLTPKMLKECQDYMGKVEDGMPFISESALYSILGKGDARSLLALVRNLADAAGLKPEEIYTL